MVEQQSDKLDRAFRALADPTRRAMLRQLASGEHNIRALAEPFAMSFAAAAKHVRVLEEAGMIERRVQGRSHFCRLNPEPLRSANEWLNFYQQFWGDRLRLLEELINTEQHPPGGNDDPPRS